MTLEFDDIHMHERDAPEPEDIEDVVPAALLNIPFSKDDIFNALHNWSNTFSGYPSLKFHPESSALFVDWCHKVYNEYGNSVLPMLLLDDYALNTEFAKTLPFKDVLDIIPTGATYGEVYLLKDSWDEEMFDYLLSTYGENVDYSSNLQYPVFQQFMRDYPLNWGSDKLESVIMLMYYQRWDNYNFSDLAEPLKKSIVESNSISGIAYLLFSRGIPERTENKNDFQNIYYPLLNELPRGIKYNEVVVMHWSRQMFNAEDQHNPFSKIESGLQQLRIYDQEAGYTTDSPFTAIWEKNLQQMRLMHNLDVDIKKVDWASNKELSDASLSCEYEL